MNDVERRALALLNAARDEGGSTHEALCRAIEAGAAERAAHDAFRQEVSEAIEGCALTPAAEARLGGFIIAKPDPLVEALNDMKDGRAGPTTESYAACLRAALAKRGLEIREVGQ